MAFCGSLKSTWLKACVFSPTEKSTLGALPGRWFKMSLSLQEDVRAGCGNTGCEAQSSLPSSLRGSKGHHALLAGVGVCRIRLGSL